MSNYVVLVRFDEETNSKYIKLQGKLMANGYSISEWPPHITISAYKNIDENLICEWMSFFAATHKQLNLGLCSMSILPPENSFECAGLIHKTAVSA